VVLGVAWRGSGLKTWTASLFAPATLTDEQAPPTELYRRASEALRVYYRDGNANLDKAIAQLELALQKKPEYPQAQARLSLAYLRKNSLNRDAEWRKRALAHADAAVAGNSQLALAHLAQGAARAANAELDKAAESYDRAAILDPANSELLWRQGDLAATRKDQVKAEEYFRRAVIAAPDDWEAHVRRGAFLYRMARYEEAVKEFEIARDGAPDHTRVYASLAGVYHQLGRTDEAAAALQRSLDIAEDDITYSNLGTLLYFQGKYDDAERAFDQAVRLGANNYQRWGNLADAVRMTAPGSQKMHDSYRRAIQLARTVMGTLVATTAAETRSSMAVYLARDGQLPAAAAELDTLLGEKQLLAATLHNAALVAELTNQRAKALNLIERALVAGYQLQEIKQEPDFVKLRTDPAYHLLASKYEK
jgi:serine/threonine-protein kinase